MALYLGLFLSLYLPHHIIYGKVHYAHKNCHGVAFILWLDAETRNCTHHSNF